MNRPPLFSREGALALFIYSGIAVAIGLSFRLSAVLIWDKAAGFIIGSIAAIVTFLMLCSVYTGSCND